MISVQRHRKIVEHVLGHGEGRVSDLARAFGVTEETIRRDLKALADRGVLTRTHGGAVPAEADEPPYVTREATNPLAKEAIAREAVRLLESDGGDAPRVIALDASTTACRLARLLPDRPMIVVTNSLVICSLLAQKSRIEVICTGGSLDGESMAFTGLHARRTLESFNIDTLFFSCRGVDVERGLSEASDAHASIKSQMIGAAERAVLMVDSSKLGARSTVFIGPVSLADVVITERGGRPDADEQLAGLRSAAGEVLLAETA